MTNGEIKFYHYQIGTDGTFHHRLFEAMMKADSDNLDKLELGFPEEVAAVYRYRLEPGYFEKLKDEWRDKPWLK